MDLLRKQWNQQQQALRKALANGAVRAIEIFLNQHGMVHSAATSSSAERTFEEEVWQGLSEAQAGCIPAGGEHSIAWVMWHLARIEDVTMNVLLAGSGQVLHSGDWLKRLGVDREETGNGMDVSQVAELSRQVELRVLRDYRTAVGRRTRVIVRDLQAADFKRGVEASRLAKLASGGAINEASRGLLDYWGGLTVAGLLLMPPTRHNFVHLNEAMRIKAKCRHVG